MLSLTLVQLREALAKVPYITWINSQDDYDQALKLMGELVEEYDVNKQLIELLGTSIEHWEDRIDEFAAFNKAVVGIKPGLAVLKTLMSQYHLGIADLPELGSKSNVSKLLDAVEDKKLTRQHIEALSKRFAVPPTLFF